MRKLILFLMMLICSREAWAAYPTYTICPSSCDYSTLNGAIADIKANHATLANNVTITISGSWASADTTAVTFSSINVNGHTVLITATGTARENGVYQATGAYTLNPASGSAITVNNSTNNVNLTIDGLQLKATSGDVVTFSNYENGYTLSNNILISSGGSCIANNNPRGTDYFYNNICYGATNSFNAFVNSESGGGDGSTTLYIYNNTAYNVYDGIQGFNNGGNSNSCVIKNNLMMNCSDKCYNSIGNSDTGSYNASSDTTGNSAILTNGLTGKTSYTSYFTSPSGNNFSLLVGSPFIAASTNNFTSTFSTDITGATRQQSGNWDMGAFYYFSGNLFSTIINNAVIKNATIN